MTSVSHAAGWRRFVRPGVLVLVSTPSADPLVADNVGWHRTVAQAGLPRATVVEIQGAGHFPQEEAPAEVSRAIREHLK